MDLRNRNVRQSLRRRILVQPNKTYYETTHTYWYDYETAHSDAVAQMAADRNIVSAEIEEHSGPRKNRKRAHLFYKLPKPRWTAKRKNAAKAARAVLKRMSPEFVPEQDVMTRPIWRG